MARSLNSGNRKSNVVEKANSLSEIRNRYRELQRLVDSRSISLDMDLAAVVAPVQKFRAMKNRALKEGHRTFRDLLAAAASGRDISFDVQPGTTLHETITWIVESHSVDLLNSLDAETQKLFNEMPTLIAEAGFSPWCQSAWDTFSDLLHKPLIHWREFSMVSHDQLISLTASSILHFADACKGVQYSLADELATLLDCLPARSSRLLRARWGLNSGPIPSLEELGNMEGITRERVRQVVTAFEERAKTGVPPLVSLMVLAEGVRQCGAIITPLEIYQKLPKPLRPDSEQGTRTLTSMSELGWIPPLAEKGGYWISSSDSFSEVQTGLASTITEIRSVVRQDLRRWGAVRSEKISEINLEDGIGLAVSLLSRSSREACRKIDGWLVPASKRRSSLTRLAYRLTSTLGAVSLSRIHKQLRRPLRQSPPISVLRAVLVRDLGVAVDDNDIVSLQSSHLAEGTREQTSEDLALQIIGEHGGAMTLGSLQKSFVKRGYSAASATVIGSRSIMLERLAPNVLGIVGVSVDLELISRLRRQAASTLAVTTLGFRQDRDGNIHFMYRVDPELLGVAIFGLPAKKVELGKWPLRDQDTKSLIVKKSYVVGPNRHIRSLLAGKHRTVCITFHTTDHTASISLR